MEWTLAETWLEITLRLDSIYYFRVGVSAILLTMTSSLNISYAYAEAWKCHGQLKCPKKVWSYGKQFLPACRTTLLHCKLRWIVAHTSITASVSNLSHNEMQCCELRQHGLQSRLVFLHRLTILHVCLCGHSFHKNYSNFFTNCHC